MAVKSEARSKRDIMHELLGQYGNSLIAGPEFRRRIAEAGLSDEDIDLYCRGELK